MSRILVIDDEPAIRRLLDAILKRDGHETIVTGNGKDALSELSREPVDAVLLDLGLPDRDGLEIISAIRLQSAVPVVILTARHDTREKITALDLGADDYITKPFDADELLARLRSILRRSGSAATSSDMLEFGPITMDIARHEVRVDDNPVALTPREFAVLQTLLEASGRILTHETLLERVWGKSHLHDIDYLRVVIRALRVKLEKNPSEPKMIRNEPGIGYRLIA